MLSDRLRRAGVMTTIINDDSSRLYSSSGVLMVGVWVAFDDQHDDAIQLIKNENHQPARVITLKEMDELEHSAKEQLASLSWGALKKIVGVSFLALVAVLGIKFAWKIF